MAGRHAVLEVDIHLEGGVTVRIDIGPPESLGLVPGVDPVLSRLAIEKAGIEIDVVANALLRAVLEVDGVIDPIDPSGELGLAGSLSLNGGAAVVAGDLDDGVDVRSVDDVLAVRRPRRRRSSGPPNQE